MKRGAEKSIGEYRAYLAPAAEGEIIGLITVLRAHYFTPEMPEGLAIEVVKDWARDLAEFPAWAVQRACDRYRRTKTDIPHPATLRKYALDATYRMRRELSAMERAVAAKGEKAEKPPKPVTAGEIKKIYKDRGVKVSAGGHVISLGEAAEMVVGKNDRP